MKKNDLKAKAVKTKDLIGYNESAVISRTIIDKPSGTITAFSFDKGQGLSEHTAPFDAMAEIIDGEAEITIEGKKNIVKEGEFIIMPARKTHALKAVQKFKMLLIMIKA
jgi:quercetin dioxygenase-like cupin family protein